MTKRNRDHILIEELANGADQRAAARAAGVSESTVYRRLRDPEFCRRLEDRCDQRSRLRDMAMLEHVLAAGDVLLDVAQQLGQRHGPRDRRERAPYRPRTAPTPPQRPGPPEPQGPSAVDVIRQRLAEMKAREAAEGSVEDSTDPPQAEK